MDETAPSSIPLRDVVTDALRYWEPRRIPYDLMLVVVGYFAIS